MKFDRTGASRARGGEAGRAAVELAAHLALTVKVGDDQLLNLRLGEAAQQPRVHESISIQKQKPDLLNQMLGLIRDQSAITASNIGLRVQQERLARERDGLEQNIATLATDKMKATRKTQALNRDSASKAY